MMENYDYCYEIPIDIESREEVDVLNRHHEREYILQRYNKNIIDLILSSRNPESAVNIVLKDPTGKRLVEAVDAWSLRRKFHLRYPDQSNHEKIVATEVNNLQVVNKKLTFEKDQHTYTIFKEAFEKRTTVYQDDKEIMYMEYDRTHPPRKNYIKVLRDELDPKVALCLLHAFEIGVY